MSVEIKFLAAKINKFNMADNYHPDIKVYEEAWNQIHIIRRDITFINPQALETITQFLNDNGKMVYEKVFQKDFIKEILKGKHKK